MERRTGGRREWEEGEQATYSRLGSHSRRFCHPRSRSSRVCPGWSLAPCRVQTVVQELASEQAHSHSHDASTIAGKASSFEGGGDKLPISRKRTRANETIKQLAILDLELLVPARCHRRRRLIVVCLPPFVGVEDHLRIVTAGEAQGGHERLQVHVGTRGVVRANPFCMCMHAHTRGHATVYMHAHK